MFKKSVKIYPTKMAKTSKPVDLFKWREGIWFLLDLREVRIINELIAPVYEPKFALYKASKTIVFIWMAKEDIITYKLWVGFKKPYVFFEKTIDKKRDR